MAGDRQHQAAQRRSHVRVEMERSIRVRGLGHAAEDASLMDLSGTGCGFRTTLPLEEGTKAFVTIAFEGWLLDCPVRCRFVRIDGRSRYVGAEFEGLTKGEVEQVVKEVFVEQRRQLKRRSMG